ARISARPALVARPDRLEELLHRVEVAHGRDRLAAGVQVTALGKRDQLLDDRTDVLGLGQRGDDLLVPDERRRKVREQRLAVADRAAEAAARIVMTHRRTPDDGCRRPDIRWLD